MTLDNLDIIKQYRDIYYTSNEQYVLGKDFEKVLAASEYKILGFLNGYMYSSYGNSIAKISLDGLEISRVALDCDHAALYESKTFFYTWYEKSVTKISKDLNIEWTMSFEDDIKSITMDVYGSIYILFETSRTIRKFSSDKQDILFITESEDVTKTCRLYKAYVTPGAGFLYVIGSQFYGYDNTVDSFIDKYNTKTGKRISRDIFAHATGIKKFDELYEYDNFILKGDYIYIYAKEYISKINIKGIAIWSYTVGYNALVGEFNQIGYIEYDNNTYEEYLYFCEDLYDTNGHTFGKLSTTGRMIWKLSLESSINTVEFKMSSYRGVIYTSNKANIQAKTDYTLSLDDDNILFKTRNGSLIKVIEYNDELYSADNYEGFYLLGDTIKDGIDKVLSTPLRYDYGHIITETNDVILLPINNPNYTDLDNYNYFNLLYSKFSYDQNDLSVLYTKALQPIKTMLGNLMKTKVAYTGSKTYDFITNIESEKILTTENEALVRSKIVYAYTKYLLADKNMFYEDIITKKDELVIVTKETGSGIMRKLREVYRFVLSKYNDMNIVSEWLIQNGVLNTDLPKYVDKLRHHTVSMIQSMQVAGVPSLYDIQATKLYNYTYDGYSYANQTYGTQIFACNNLPFNKHLENPTKIYMDSIANLVESKEIRPFMVFLNGIAIKWTDCTIIKDWSYTYIIVRNTDVANNTLQCIEFPCNIRYGEDADILNQELNVEHLYFTEAGLLTEDADSIAFRIEIVDANVNGGTQYNKSFIEINTNESQLASEKNILVFEDGKLFADSRFYMMDYSDNMFAYNTIGRDVSITTFKTFYYISANEYYGTILKVPNQKQIHDEIETSITLPTAQGTTYDKFINSFNFKLYKTKSYERNIADAVNYIMQYDMNLLIQYYKNKSNIKSYVFNADDVIDRAADNGGFLKLPRCRRNNLSDHVIMFVDSNLYEYNNEIVYSSRDFKIPIFSHVPRGSKVEILHFCNVDNSIYTLSVDADESDYISDNLRYDNFLLFGHSITGSGTYVDEFNPEAGIFYDVNFNYRNTFTESGKYSSTEIELQDEYYLGKNLSICSKRQFQYMYYTMRESSSSFNLSPDFRFCHLKNHYMIFVNKKKITFSEFDLHVIDFETNLKWNYITTTTPLLAGDIIEIYYLPDSYEEIVVENTDSKGHGDICIDMNDLGYQFDRDLLMIFIDGMKINYSAIENISANRVRITNESGVINNNVSVMKFLQPDELLSEIFSYSDYWSRAIDSLTPIQYETLLLNKIQK